MATKKPRVLASQFLDWYFSDKDDLITIGNSVRDTLQKVGRYSITVEHLYRECGYIPGDLIITGDNNREYQPSDCILINDIII